MPETGKILVIDDEIGICEGIKRALTSSGYDVDTATSSEEGLEMVRDGNYDLVLLDVMMPGISGIDLLPSILAHDPELVCIIITGYATVELAVRTIKQGAYDFLTKPFSVDELNLAVSQGLERRRLSLEAKRVQAAEAESRRLAEEKFRLEELDKTKRQFIRLMTHELQSPLDAIQSYLNLIQDGYVPPERMKEIIEKCILRLNEERDLINDLLELGRLEMLGAPEQGTNVQLEEILEETLAKFKEQASKKQITVITHIAPELPPVSGNPAQISSLWTNLISNAIKYTPEGGTITVSLSAKGNRLHAEVADTGIGISPEDQKYLFAEFFRAKNAREQGAPGTGLGLSIVKRIIESLKGEIAVTSELGRGTVFSFDLPVNVPNSVNDQ